MTQAPQTGRPSRYQRSFSGLVGSMVVLVLLVVGFVIFRGVFRDNPDYQLDHVDYRDLVVGLQQLGAEPVYPAELPDGWFAKGSSSVADAPVLDLAFAAGAVDQTAGLHQEHAPERDLVRQYVGNAATEDGDTLTTELGTWTGWDDVDGDHAWTAEVGGDTVLAYSSGDPGELRDLVESLTTAKLTP